VDDPVIAIRNFDQAEVRTFPRGRFELCELGGHVIGRAVTSPAGDGPATWARWKAPASASTATSAW
jgi:hypothetical protein